MGEPKEMSEWPKVITLEKLVEAHGEHINKLVLHEPTGGDIMQLPLMIDSNGGFTLPTIALACSMAKVPPSTIKSLGLNDTMAVLKVVNPLAGQYLATLEM